MKLYRYERGGVTIRYNMIDDCCINLSTFHVIEETKKSYIIFLHHKRKAISKTGRKRFAYPTKQEAKINFIKRTESCIKYTRTALESAKEYLHKIKNTDKL